MYTNLNLAAPVGALALLGTAFLLFLTAILLVQSLIVREHRRAKVVLLALLDAKPATLLINEDAWETRLVIGHENSLLHKKTRFQL